MSSDSLLQDKSIRLKEFLKLRDLMLSASVSPSVAMSSIAVDDSADANSFFHYDIRERDSLMESTNHYLSVESSVSVSLPGSSISRLSLVRSSVATDSSRNPGIAFCTQTVPNSDPEELSQLRTELIPTLETEISIGQSHIAASESSRSNILSRLTNSLVFEPLHMRLASGIDWSPVFLTGDGASIDVFATAGDPSPLQSFPLRTCLMRVSGRLGELQLFSLKVHKVSFRIENSVRFKKILFTLKLIGVSVSLVDVPADIISLKHDSSNPRRTVRGD